MKTIKYALATFTLIVLFGQAVRADTFTTFQITGTFDCVQGACPTALSFSPGSTVTVDTTTGLVTASAFSIESWSGVFPSPPSVDTGIGPVSWYGSGGENLDLRNFTSALSGGTETSEIYPNNSNTGWFAMGTYQLEAVPEPGTELVATPEPGSLLLLGTGLASCLGLIRRKRS